MANKGNMNAKEGFFSFQNLKVWQKAVGFAERVIKVIDAMDTPRKHYPESFEFCHFEERRRQEKLNDDRNGIS